MLWNSCFKIPVLPDRLISASTNRSDGTKHLASLNHAIKKAGTYQDLLTIIRVDINQYYFCRIFITIVSYLILQKYECEWKNFGLNVSFG